MDIMERAAQLNKRYADFIDECDKREESQKWDIEQRGQMEMYIANELTCILLRLSASDGKISDEEVALYNTIMGTDYSTAGLTELYNGMADTIRSYSVEGFISDLDILKKEFPEMTAIYALIVCEACQLLVESDGIITKEETEEANKLMAAIGI